MQPKTTDFPLTKRSSPSKSPKKKKIIFSEKEIEAIKQRRLQKEKSIEDKLKEIVITNTEKKSLDKVFNLISTNGESFAGPEISRILKMMDMNLSKSEIDLMIWEVDEDLDECVDRKEFENMYKRCISDKSGLEPKSLFHLVQFLMYCKKGKFTITVEDTLELLYVSLGREDLTGKIKDLFGEEEKNGIDWQEKEISFNEYLEKITKKAIEQRKEKLKEKSRKYTNLKKKEID